jgi:hypothetical protein
MRNKMGLLLALFLALVFRSPAQARGSSHSYSSHSYSSHSYSSGSYAHRSRSSSSGAGDVSVHSYTRRDGTFVQSHHRSHPDHNFWNNWTTKGNVNPYTGKEGTKTTPPPSEAN